MNPINLVKPEVILQSMRRDVDALLTHEAIPHEVRTHLYNKCLAILKSGEHMNERLRKLSQVQYANSKGFPTYTFLTCCKAENAALLVPHIKFNSLRHRVLSHWSGIDSNYGIPSDDNGQEKVIRAAHKAGIDMSILHSGEEETSVNSHISVPLISIAPLHMVKVLSNLGIDVNTPHPITGETTLHNAIKNFFEGHAKQLDTIKELLLLGTRVDMKALQLVKSGDCQIHRMTISSRDELQTILKTAAKRAKSGSEDEKTP